MDRQEARPGPWASGVRPRCSISQCTTARIMPRDFFGRETDSVSNKRARPVEPAVDRAPPTSAAFAHFKNLKAAADFWWEGTCNYCEGVYRLKTYRAEAHLGHIAGKGVTACPRVPAEVRSQFSDGGSSRPAAPPLASSSASQATLRAAWQPCAAQEVDAKVARFFYSNGLSFHVASTKSFQEMCAALRNAPLSWVPTTPWNLAHKLLKAEVTTIKSRLEIVLATCAEYGFTIASDGWTDTRHRPLMNVMYLTVNGSFFMEVRTLLLYSSSVPMRLQHRARGVQRLHKRLHMSQLQCCSERPHVQDGRQLGCPAILWMSNGYPELWCDHAGVSTCTQTCMLGSSVLAAATIQAQLVCYMGLSQRRWLQPQPCRTSPKRPALPAYGGQRSALARGTARAQPTPVLTYRWMRRAQRPRIPSTLPGSSALTSRSSGARRSVS